MNPVVFSVWAADPGMVVWKIAACALGGLFAVLHLIAVASQMKKDFRPSLIVMLVGALGVAAAVIDCLLGGRFDWLLMALGGGMACGCAYWNGKRAGNVHLSHHIVRFAVVLLLALSFVQV